MPYYTDTESKQTPNSCHQSDYEQEWEERRSDHRAFELSQKVAAWSKAGSCSEHIELILQLLTAKGFTLLANSWNSTDDGFPYHVSFYNYAHHQSLMFQGPNNMAFAFILRYSTKSSDEGSTHSLSVNVVCEVTDENLRPTFGSELGLRIRGMTGGSSSWGGQSSKNRFSYSQHFEPHDYGVLPDPSDFVAAIEESLQVVRDVTPEAPLSDWVYLGNNIDNSYVFPKSDSFELFWERAGGRDKVIAFAPKAIFTKAWIDKQGRKQY